MKFFVKLSLLCVLFFFIHKFCSQHTSGFKVKSIQSNIPFHSEWEVENDPLDLTIFNQKFSYLGAGGQAYAFASEDDLYVIKFFKHHYQNPKLWQKGLLLLGPLGKKKRLQIDNHWAKLYRDFNSYVLAKNALSEEAGLLYVHLNKTEKTLPKIQVIDRLNIRHLIPLDKVEFILQRRATLLYPHLTSLIEKNELEEAKHSLDAIITLVQSRSQKGIHDEDAKIHRNLGFLGSQAMIIDVGRLKMNEQIKDPVYQKENLKAITERLHTFLIENSPELATYLEKRIDEL